MQVQWRRLFAIVFGVLIWAATVALLEVCVFTFWFWKAWGFSGGNDAAGVVALGFCLIALPLATALAIPIALLAWGKCGPADRMRQGANGRAGKVARRTLGSRKKAGRPGQYLSTAKSPK
jgi:hypothetical protein